MTDMDLLKEHAIIMKGVSNEYISPLMRGKQRSNIILDLSINDISNLITNAESREIKTGFKESKAVLTHLNGLSSDDLPDKATASYRHNPIINGLVALQSIMNSCGEYGINIADRRYVGKNPCRHRQYDATEILDEIRSRFSTSKLPESVKPLMNALDSYLKQCITCPYKAFEKNYRK